jgi:hypothetical protein
VEPHRLENGPLYVQQGPQVASRLDDADVGPGAARGSAVFTSQVNYAHVLGAFGDLTSYRPGQHIGVTRLSPWSRQVTRTPSPGRRAGTADR